MGTGKSLSDLIEQVRQLLAEDDHPLAGKTDKPARMAKVLRVAKKAGATGGMSGGHEAEHKHAHTMAQAHAQISADHAKKGDRAQAAHHASLSAGHYDAAAKSARAMGFHALANSHLEKGHEQRVAAYNHTTAAKKK